MESSSPHVDSTILRRFVKSDSEDRREYIENLCALITGEDLDLRFDPKSSYVDMKSEKIYIVSEFPDRGGKVEIVDSLLLQKYSAYHESAHVLFTDLGPIKDNPPDGPNSKVQNYKKITNAVEDIYIDAAIEEIYDVQEQFGYIRDKLYYDQLEEFRITDPMEDVMMFFRSFISRNQDTYVQDRGTILTKKTSKVKDFIESNIWDCMIDDPEKRSEKISWFAKEVLEMMGDYAEMQTYTQGQLLPENAGENSREIQIDVKKQKSPPQKFEEIPEEKKREIKDSAAPKDPVRESLEKWQGSGEYLESLFPEPPENRDKEEKEASRQLAKRVEYYLSRCLKEERRSEKKKNLSTGRFSNRSIPKVKRGNQHVFTQIAEPDEKDYSCVILTDFSGSMSSQIVEVTKAVGGMALAMENVGISCSIVSITDNSVIVDKDFEEPKGYIWSRSAGGGTPLTPGLRVSRDRLQKESRHPFILVVTDGFPDEEEKYKQALEDTNIPVLGLYVNEAARSQGHSKYFHRLDTSAPEPNKIMESLRRLVSRSVL